MLGARVDAALNDAFVSAVRAAPIRRLWDVGANMGWYSWVFLSHVVDGQAVLLEPDPANLDLLRRTARRLGARATILPLAAGDRTGSAPFVRDPLTGATGSLVLEEYFLARHYGRREGTIDVETTRLDDLLGRFEAPDLIKIDVEGAERLVFAGAPSLLDRQPVVVYETTAANREHLAALLIGHGYLLFDAEGYGRREQTSPNVLAWPARLHDRTGELVAVWRSRRPAS
ncbi:MAG TPA: FkbM family methyltransferase [Alphaproteobacteria bacterium]|nr:FkbM family methyltransferase [Alphaproteobacteria bacterium]